MKASEIINEAVLGGSVPAGPRTGEDYAYKIMDLRDRIDRATDFSTKEHLKIALNDLQRVALQRGIIDANGKIVKEDATAGATGSSSVAAVVGSLGGPQNIIKRQQNYTNQRTKGGPVKVKK